MVVMVMAMIVAVFMRMIVVTVIVRVAWMIVGVRLA